MKEALRLLGVYTGGRFDVWMLVGPANAAHRAQVLSALRGSRVPQSKAGVNALKGALYSEAGVTGDCEADRDRNFVAFCKGSIPNTHDADSRRAARLFN